MKKKQLSGLIFFCTSFSWCEFSHAKTLFSDEFQISWWEFHLLFLGLLYRYRYSTIDNAILGIFFFNPFLVHSTNWSCIFIRLTHCQTAVKLNFEEFNLSKWMKRFFVSHFIFCFHFFFLFIFIVSVSLHSTVWFIVIIIKLFFVFFFCLLVKMYEVLLINYNSCSVY